MFFMVYKIECVLFLFCVVQYYRKGKKKSPHYYVVRITYWYFLRKFNNGDENFSEIVTNWGMERGGNYFPKTTKRPIFHTIKRANPVQERPSCRFG